MLRYRVECVFRSTIATEPQFTDIWVEADSPADAHDAVENDDVELMVIDVYTEDGECCIY